MVRGLRGFPTKEKQLLKSSASVNRERCVKFDAFMKVVMAIDPLPLELSEWIMNSEPTEVVKTVKAAESLSRGGNSRDCGGAMDRAQAAMDQATRDEASMLTMQAREAAASERAKQLETKARVAAATPPKLRSDRSSTGGSGANGSGGGGGGGGSGHGAETASPASTPTGRGGFNKGRLGSFGTPSKLVRMLGGSSVDLGEVNPDDSDEAAMSPVRSRVVRARARALVRARLARSVVVYGAERCTRAALFACLVLPGEPRAPSGVRCCAASCAASPVALPRAHVLLFASQVIQGFTEDQVAQRIDEALATSAAAHAAILAANAKDASELRRRVAASEGAAKAAESETMALRRAAGEVRGPRYPWTGGPRVLQSGALLCHTILSYMTPGPLLTNNPR